MYISPIISGDIWEAVQAKLEGRSNRRAGRASTNGSLLTGLIVDEKGRRLTPNHAVKGNRRYRYYISSALNGKRTQNDNDRGWRLPAEEIENLVKECLNRFLGDQLQLIGALSPDTPTMQEMERIAEFSQSKPNVQSTDDLVRRILKRVTVSEDKLHLELSTASLREIIGLRPIEHGQQDLSTGIPD